MSEALMNQIFGGFIMVCLVLFIVKMAKEAID